MQKVSIKQLQIDLIQNTKTFSLLRNDYVRVQRN